MARLWQSGFELNSLTAGVECDTTNVSGGGAVAIDTATVRSGTYSLKASNAGASGLSRVNFRLLTSAGSGPYYARAYFNIADFPGSTNNIMTIWDGTTVRSTLKLAADGTLELHDSGGKIGSSSSALSTGTWYRLELKYYSNGAATELEGKIDGTSFASTTSSSNSGTVDRLSVGMVSNNTSYELYVDDIAVNDSSGSYQTGYPGEGKIVHVMPTSAGDSSSWTGYAGSGANWERVDEFPPDDATSAIQSRTTDEVDEYGIVSPLGSGDTINTIAVGYRVNRSAGTTSSTFNVRLKGSSGGLNESATWTASSTTWRTNNTDVNTVIGYPVVSYINPDTSTAWTSSTLDTAQIGIKTVSGSGDRYVNLSTIWASVDYAAGAATTTSTSSSTSTSTSSTSTSMSTSTSSTSTSLSTSTSSTSTSLSTSTSTSTSSTSTSQSTSTSISTSSTSTSTTQSMTTSTSSTSTSLSTSSTSQSTSTSLSTSTSTSTSTSSTSSSTSQSTSTSSTSTSQSTSTSSTSTSQSTSTSSTSRSTSTSSTSSSTSTSISTSTSSTSVSTSTSTSTSSTSLSTSTSFSTSTSTSSTSSSTSSTSSSTSSTTTLPPDSRVIPTLKMPLKDLFIKHKMSR